MTELLLLDDEVFFTENTKPISDVQPSKDIATI